ncbi:MAG TPA: 4-hydroxy-3-methylbut-2-enyl diphosphate reductase [Acidimicrobiia bacterium]|nr:4-hydroxy-3-methylbut-2-enyl diphosphate reductase [Acidimicrobiia bacterium]
MVDQVLLAEPRGFCAGVEMAIKALTWMIRVFDPPVYCYHEIVHNEWVVGAFENVGVVFVDDIAQVPHGAPLMLSAHGSAPEVVSAAHARAGVVIDAVCPLVTKVHHEVKRMAEQGFDIIYVGHEGHDEAIGTVAEAPDAITLVEPDQVLSTFTPRDDSRVALLAQTTLGLHEWEAVLDAASRQFAGLETARRSDLCYATTNRQAAVKDLAEQADLILVVGSETSSNTRALVRVAMRAGTTAYRVDSADQIEESWLDGVGIVGVTAGASAPDHLVREVIDRLSPTAGYRLARVTDEDEYFPLPRQLRGFLTALQFAVEGGFCARAPGQNGPLQEDRTWTATEALSALTSHQ